MEKEIITTTTNEVSETYKTAVQTHQRILANGEICAQSLLEICKDLKKMRDEKLYEEFGYAAFDEYTEKAVGIKPRQAYTYISTYERLGATVLQSNASLGITKLDLIAQINPVERTQMLAENTFDGMSVSEVKALVQKAKDQGEQISLLQEELAEVKAQSEPQDTEPEYDAEKNEMRDRIAALEKQLTDSAAEHKAALEKAKREAAEQAKKETGADAQTQKRIDEAVKKAKKEALKEALKEAQEKVQAEAEKKDSKIKDLEAALSAAGAEHEKLEKQLSLADGTSAKAMVYIQSIQDNFNALFAVMEEMPDEQKNKFTGACMKLLNAMRAQVEK